MIRTHGFLLSFVLALASLVASPKAVLAQDDAKVDLSELLIPPAAVSITMLRAGADSFVVAPGQRYAAGAFHRWLFGDLRRDIWSIAFKVPVVRLDTLAGGVTVQELSGGLQTLGLRLLGKDSVPYQFRSVVKDPRRALPSELHWSPFARATLDQMASQFPLAPMVVAELLEAVGVLVAKPHVVIMPDDERLGEYREAFAGRMGWIEERPEEREGDRPGFAGSSKITGTDELLEELGSNPRSYVNARAMLTSRMVDFIVGDWDRHSDQWRWARFPDGDLFRWDPIPRDRDWAFARIDGLLTGIAPGYYVQYVGFDADYPPVHRLSWASQRVDRTFLISLDRDQFMDVATAVAARLTDEVLASSVAVLPPEYADPARELLATMRARRDHLVRAAGDFYTLLAREPGINGTLEADSVTVTATGNSVRVQLQPASGAGFVFDRTFAAGETEEIRIFLKDGDDRVVIDGANDLPIIVRISTGNGDDLVADRTSGHNVRVYSSGADDSASLGGRAFVTRSEYLAQDSARTAKMIWNSRDWGSSTYLLPAARIESNIGLLLGAKLHRRWYGYGQDPCTTCISLGLIGAVSVSEWIAEFDMERRITPSGIRITAAGAVHSGEPARFHGIGNDIVPAEDERPYMGFRRVGEFSSGLRYKASHNWHADLAVVYKRAGYIREKGASFADDVYGASRFEQLGVAGAVELDTRDDPALPTRGGKVDIGLSHHPSLLDVRTPFSSVRGNVEWYRALALPLEPALHLRFIGEKLWGTAPFAELPSLGGSSTLPGYSRTQFRGDAMASGAALLRARLIDVKLLTTLHVGVHGVAATGRVWAPNEESSTWHRSTGGGVWIHSASLKRTASVTLARGDRQRIYFDFGFLF